MAGSQTFSTSSGTDVTLTTTSEIEVIQLDGVTTGAGGGRITLRGSVQVTTGTGATALTLRVRRGTSTAGTLVGEANAVQIEAAAGSTEDHDIQVSAVFDELVGESFVLTVQQTAATGNGTAVQAALSATT